MIKIDELNSNLVLVREEEIDEKDKENVVLGDSYVDHFGEQFVFVTETGKFFYSDLQNASERIILGQVNSFLSIL